MSELKSISIFLNPGNKNHVPSEEQFYQEVIMHKLILFSIEIIINSPCLSASESCYINVILAFIVENMFRCIDIIYEMML